MPHAVWEDEGAENSLLNVSDVDALAVSLSPFIFVLMFLVGSFDGWSCCWAHLGAWKTQYMRLEQHADQNPLAKRALSMIMADRYSGIFFA